MARKTLGDWTPACDNVYKDVNPACAVWRWIDSWRKKMKPMPAILTVALLLLPVYGPAQDQQPKPNRPKQGQGHRGQQGGLALDLKSACRRHLPEEFIFAQPARFKEFCAAVQNFQAQKDAPSTELYPTAWRQKAGRLQKADSLHGAHATLLSADWDLYNGDLAFMKALEQLTEREKWEERHYLAFLKKNHAFFNLLASMRNQRENIKNLTSSAAVKINFFIERYEKFDRACQEKSPYRTKRCDGEVCKFSEKCDSDFGKCIQEGLPQAQMGSLATAGGFSWCALNLPLSDEESAKHNLEIMKAYQAAENVYGYIWDEYSNGSALAEGIKIEEKTK